MAKFQVQLGGEWKDYSNDEDRVLKRAYMAGSPRAKLEWKGKVYMCDFRKMMQVNEDTGKEHRIRQPYKWKAPGKPLVPSGPTKLVKVPPGSPGTTIQVQHPRIKGTFIHVAVPASAKPGQAMLVPVPSLTELCWDRCKGKPVKGYAPPTSGQPAKDARVFPQATRQGASVAADIELSVDRPAEENPTSPDRAITKDSHAPVQDGSGDGSWSTGGKIGASLAMGGVAVAGVLLGAIIADDSDATLDAIVEGSAEAVEAVDVVSVDAGEFVVDAGEDTADAVADIF